MAWLELLTWRHWQFHLALNVSHDVTGQFHLALLDRITWCYWTVSPGVTEPHHLMLLDSFTWRYWIVSPDVTGRFHLSLLNLFDSFTLRYWNLSPDVTGQQSSCSICNDQLFNLRLIAINRSTWQISQFDDIGKLADRYLANNWQIKRALPARQTIASRVTSFTIHNSPEFSRKLTYFLRLFLNTGFCSKRKWRFCFSFCFAEFVDCYKPEYLFNFSLLSAK